MASITPAKHRSERFIINSKFGKYIDKDTKNYLYIVAMVRIFTTFAAHMRSIAATQVGEESPSNAEHHAS